jgi:hypothetical protein
MYDVEARIPWVSPGNQGINSAWEDIYNVPQYETDATEYQYAVAKAREFREFYKHVRVVKILPGGLREVVRECPYTHSHTRKWCGFSECREG